MTIYDISKMVGGIGAENPYGIHGIQTKPTCKCIRSVTVLNADFDCPNVFCTLCDDFRAMQEATLSLLDSGIKDIL